MHNRHTMTIARWPLASGAKNREEDRVRKGDNTGNQYCLPSKKASSSGLLELGFCDKV